MAITVPSGIRYYVPITITNSQSSATPAPFQQMIQIKTSNYSQLVFSTSTPQANFEFFTASGTIVPAWIESYTSPTLTVWVNIANGIAANSTATIYLGIGSSSANFLSNSGTSGIGMAPELGPVYAQYDNGASVFPSFYDNFAGTSLNTTLWTNDASNASGILTINNGMSYTRGSTGNSYYFIYSNSTSFSTGIYETYGNIPAGGLSGDDVYAFFGLAASSNCIYVGDFSSEYGLRTSNSSGAAITIGLPGGTFIWQIYIPSSSPSIIYASQNYGTQISSNTYIPTLPLAIVYIDQSNTGINIGPFYWVRSRAYPPSGTAPTNTFGSIIHTVQIWNGTAWQAQNYYVWNGSSWVLNPSLKTWNGTSWT